jgi:hypothetical protein
MLLLRLGVRPFQMRDDLGIDWDQLLLFCVETRSVIVDVYFQVKDRPPLRDRAPIRLSRRCRLALLCLLTYLL